MSFEKPSRKNSTIRTQRAMADLLEKDRISKEEMRAAVDIVLPSLHILGITSGAVEGAPLAAEDVITAVKRLQAVVSPPPATGTSENLRPKRRGLGRNRRPARLPRSRNLIRLLSVYKMKDRAGRVGSSGVAALLRALLAKTDASIHLVGTRSAPKLCYQRFALPNHSNAPQNPPSSSSLRFRISPSRPTCRRHRPGGYMAALSADRVEKPIFSTYSRSDFPLHDIFHLMLR